MSRIFISHSSRDNFAAIAIRDWLAGEGWNEVFLDLDPDRGIVAGERWERALHEAATRCEAVVFLVSANWLASPWCDTEYALARGLNKKLLAVLIDPALTIAALPPKYTGTWQVVDLSSGQDLRVFRVPLPGSHEEAHVRFSADGLTRLKRGLEKAGLDPKFFAWPPPAEPQRAPYRGLKPLEAEDAGIFFGRGAPIVEATDRLRGLAAGAAPRLLVLLGASGAGKSSFLRAGLLPRLARDDAHFLPLAPIRPERAALTGDTGFLGALAKALPDRALGELRAAVAGGADAVRPLLAGLAQAAFKRTLADDTNARPPAIVVTIDQAEELFRPDGAAEGAALLGLVRDLTAVDDPTVIVVFAIRSDSYDALMRAKPLDGLRQETQPLSPMPRGAYMDVIEGPTKRVVEAGGRLAIEPRLTQRLLEDIEKGGGSDALPLLAFTLEQLYLEYRGAGTLLLDHYETLGGLRGAIDKAVARAFIRADADGRIPRERAARETLLRRGLIPWLAGIDPDTKSPRRAIARRVDIPAEAAPLIDLLVEERLLATDVRIETDAATGATTRTPTIEPTHEALLRQWGLLDGWLKEDFARLATLEGVQRAARDWDANARGEGWLSHGGDRLVVAQALDERPDLAAKLDATDRAYLAGCRAKEDAARAEDEARRAEREAEQARRLADAKKLTRVTAVGLAAALVLAAAAGGAAWYGQLEKREAQSQSQRATRALTAATDAANTLIFDLAQKFRNVAGVSAALVKSILDPALKLQGKLVEAGDTTPELLASQSSALDETVETLLDLGDTRGALAAATKSREITERLATSEPGNVDWQSDLSVSHQEVGDVLVAKGNLSEAQKSFRASLAIIERLATSDPSNASWQRDLSVSDDKVGNVLVAKGNLSEALKSYRAALAIREHLATSDPGNAGWQHDLSISDNRVGHVLVRKGKLSEALKSFQASFAIKERLVRSDPGNARWQRDLSVSDDNVGDVLVAQGNLAEALTSYRASLGIMVRLAASDPGNAGWQRDLSVSNDNVGDVLVAQGNLPEALTSYQASLVIAERLATFDSGNAGWQHDVAKYDLKVGDVLLAQGKLAEALTSYRTSLAIAVRLAASDPGNTGWHHDLSVSDDKVGDVLVDQGDLPAALRSYRADLEIMKRLASSDPSNSGWQRDLAVAEEKVGDTMAAQGDLPEALKSCLKAQTIFERLATSDPGNADWQRDLAASYSKLAGVDGKTGRDADARQALAAGRAIIARLTVRFPDQAQWKQDLAWFNARIAAAAK